MSLTNQKLYDRIWPTKNCFPCLHVSNTQLASVERNLILAKRHSHKVVNSFLLNAAVVSDLKRTLDKNPFQNTCKFLEFDFPWRSKSKKHHLWARPIHSWKNQSMSILVAMWYLRFRQIIHPKLFNKFYLRIFCESCSCLATKKDGISYFHSHSLLSYMLRISACLQTTWSHWMQEWQYFFNTKKKTSTSMKHCGLS